jgi:UDP-MurNAc hydroxylase
METRCTFWGHNCFLVEWESEALLIDPWLNDTGAFYGSWHHWPPNGHLRETVFERCRGKKLGIYLTHEHQDHFDKASLSCFARHPDCTVFIPGYRDKFLRDAIERLGLRTRELSEQDEAGDSLRFRIFIDDRSINHDSAIFVTTPDFSFFNQNDCKIFDRLHLLRGELGNIDYYSVQFSGATWHPACFVMPAEQRRLLSRRKALAKLHNILSGINLLAPRFFVPAAGPAFFPFLDPSFNAGGGTIFIHQDELEKYLSRNKIDNVLFPRPGDEVHEGASRVPIPAPTPADIERYRDTHVDLWTTIEDTFSKARFGEVLQRRLALLAPIALPPDTPRIAFNWGPYEDDWLVVDLQSKAMLATRHPAEPCLIVTASTRYFSLMCGQERWQDVALSMRAAIERRPDLYNTIANIFLFSDEADLAEAVTQAMNVSTERVVIEHRGQQYEINRYCPHQGGDLAYAHIDEDMNVVCPRHSWKFDLNCEGMCKDSGMSIHAVRLTEIPVAAK